jgi:hypothetical protein
MQIDEVVKNLEFRDEYDSTRKHSPLKKAQDAIIVDTTNLTIEQEIDLVVQIVQKKLEANNSFLFALKKIIRRWLIQNFLHLELHKRLYII